MRVRERIIIPILSICLLAVLGAPISSAFEEIKPGIYRSNWKMIDDLLAIGDNADLDVLILEDNKTKSISDAHMSTLRRWVESGGVLWVAGDGLESSLAQAVAPFQPKSFDFVRSTSGKRGGELIVKGLSPRMTIADHALTVGVNQLYFFARSKFDGTEQAEPLVKMGDSAGNSGWVLVAVPVGRGLMILDGTARKEHWLFGKLKGFDKAHPNSLEQDSGWNSYDWEQLLRNVQEHAHQALADGQESQPIAQRTWFDD